MEDENGKLGLEVAANLGPGLLDILLQLLDGVLEGGAGVVDLIDNQDALADQVGHLAQSGQVEPLGARDLGAGGLDIGIRLGAQGLVQREADGLDGDVGAAGLLEERAQDARGHVAAAADGNHQLRLEVGQDLGRGLLAQLVHLCCTAWLVRGDSIQRSSALDETGTTHIVVRDVELLDHFGGWRGDSGSLPLVSRQRMAVGRMAGLEASLADDTKTRLGRAREKSMTKQYHSPEGKKRQNILLCESERREPWNPENACA